LWKGKLSIVEENVWISKRRSKTTRRGIVVELKDVGIVEEVFLSLQKNIDALAAMRDSDRKLKIARTRSNLEDTDGRIR